VGEQVEDGIEKHVSDFNAFRDLAKIGEQVEDAIEKHVSDFNDCREQWLRIL
jgi:hypothetical protein